MLSHFSSFSYACLFFLVDQAGCNGKGAHSILSFSFCRCVFLVVDYAGCFVKHAQSICFPIAVLFGRVCVQSR